MFFPFLQRIITHLRKVRRNTIIIIHGDGHFCCKKLMSWATGQDKVHFLTRLTGNKLRNDLASITINPAEEQFKSTGKPVKRYHSFDYSTGSWRWPQRVKVKVEVNEKGTNIRYVVTSIRCVRTKALYKHGYCACVRMELYIKESKTNLLSDRMSCNRFEANQFRLFMDSAHTFCYMFCVKKCWWDRICKCYNENHSITSDQGCSLCKGNENAD